MDSSSENVDSFSKKPSYVHTNIVELLSEGSKAVKDYVKHHNSCVGVDSTCPYFDRAPATSSFNVPGVPLLNTASNREENYALSDACGPSPHSSCILMPETTDEATRLYRLICKVQAPMVRYSRPAFRKLCRLWGTDISYTHMIMAESFTKSALARHADFSVYDGESKLVAQIAANEGPVAAAAASLLAPYCDAIDLNCGCPQRWAMREGIGAALLERVETVTDMVHCIRNALEGSEHLIPCVVKMRINADERKSVDFARQVEAAGVGWITVHARTPTCNPSSPALHESVRLIQENLSIPVVVNGGFHDPSSALQAAINSRAGGVMMANGLLDNPAAFSCFQPGLRCSIKEAIPAYSSDLDPEKDSVQNKGEVQDEGGKILEGFRHCPLEVLSDFLRLSVETGLSSTAIIQHVLRMARPYLSPSERTYISRLGSTAALWHTINELGLYVNEGRAPFS